MVSHATPSLEIVELCGDGLLSILTLESLGIESAGLSGRESIHRPRFR